MRLLLDTHAVIWWLAGTPRLGDVARAAIDDTGTEVHVSAVSAVEIATKKAIGKLTAPDDLREQLATNGFVELALTLSHALAVGDLPLHHRDPWDRLLVVQARSEGLTLVTADRRISSYDVSIMPAED